MDGYLKILVKGFRDFVVGIDGKNRVLVFFGDFFEINFYRKIWWGID